MTLTSKPILMTKEMPQSQEEPRFLTREEVMRMSRKEAVGRILNIFDEIEKNHRIDEGRVTDKDLEDNELHNQLIKREVIEHGEYQADKGWNYRGVFVPFSRWEKPPHACYLDRLSNFALRDSRGSG